MKLGNLEVKGIVDNITSEGLKVYLEEHPAEAKAAAFLAAASAGSDFGDVDYEMIYFSQGIREGYAKGKASMGY